MTRRYLIGVAGRIVNVIESESGNRSVVQTRHDHSPD
jgi:hypothetical protein